MRLTAQWAEARHKQPVGDRQTGALPDLHPGDGCEVVLRLAAPALEQVGGSALGPSAMLAVTVEAPESGDIDTVTTYAQAEPGRDHWTVVGPTSRAEFDDLAAHKLALLRAYGFTPDSRLLDVGCGTGQLAGPLADLRSDRGAYVGTGIGAEAVAFCGDRFRRLVALTGLAAEVRSDVVWREPTRRVMYAFTRTSPCSPA